MSLFADEIDSASSTWPAFADLLAGTTLLFLVLFAAIALPAVQRSADLSRRASTLQHVEDDLRKASAASRVTVERAGDYLVVRITGDATFEQNESELSKLHIEGKEILRRFGQVLLARVVFRTEGSGDSPATAPIDLIDQIQVVGHTSVEGEEKRNWTLSAARAATIALFLIDSVGVPACMVSAMGRSHYYPVDTGFALKALRLVTSKGARQAPNSQDRRIELEVRPRIPGDDDQLRRRAACVDRSFH